MEITGISQEPEQIHLYRPYPLRGLSGADRRLRLWASLSGYRLLALDPRHHCPSGRGGCPAQITGGTEAAGCRVDGGAEQTQKDHRMRSRIRCEGGRNNSAAGRRPIAVARVPRHFRDASGQSISTGFTCQIFSQYSRIARSDENFPTLATFRTLMRSHSFCRSQVRLTFSWAAM